MKLDITPATSEAEIMARIIYLQEIQKLYKYTHARWQEASRELAPLFEEMARRQKAGHHESQNQ